MIEARIFLIRLVESAQIWSAFSGWSGVDGTVEYNKKGDFANFRNFIFQSACRAKLQLVNIRLQNL